MDKPVEPQTPERKRARRNVLLALGHVGLVIVVLAAFVYAQSHR